MAELVCHLIRSARGASIRAVRLVGSSVRELELPDADAAPTVRERVQQAADWVRDQVGTDRLAALCVDADGAVCTWVDADEAEPALLAAAVDASDSMSTDEAATMGAAAGAGVHTRLPELPGELGFTPMPTGGPRVAVAAIPDVAVRLFVDELDRRGLRPPVTVSIWQALTAAWAVRLSPTPAAVAADSDPVTAVVLIDAHHGLVWSWSDGSRTIAAGAQRLELEDGLTVLDPAALGRLAAEWMSWALQLGRGATRVLMVVPELAGNARTDAAAQLRSAWPDSSVELLDEPQPLDATLARLAAMRAPAEGLGSIARRPGRAVRGVYTWSAAALALASVGLAIIAWDIYGSAQARAGEADALLNQRAELLATEGLETDPAAAQTLESRIARELRQIVRAGDRRPILPELDAISLVIADHRVEVTSIDVKPQAVQIELVLDDTRAAEAIAGSLQQIEGSSVQWARPEYRNRPAGGIILKMLGNWPSVTTPGPSPAGGSA